MIYLTNDFFSRIPIQPSLINNQPIATNTRITPTTMINAASVLGLEVHEFKNKRVFFNGFLFFAEV
jgi:hypothetical protein